MPLGLSLLPHSPPFCSNELPTFCHAPLWRPCGLSLLSHSPQHHGLPWGLTQGGYLVNLWSQGAQKKADDAFRKPSCATVVLWPSSSAALPGKEKDQSLKISFPCMGLFFSPCSESLLSGLCMVNLPTFGDWNIAIFMLFKYQRLNYPHILQMFWCLLFL